MLSKTKRRLFIILLTTVAVVASGVFCFAASNVSVSNGRSPTTLTVGSKFSIKGTIKSDKTIKRVEIGIVNSSGKWTAYKYDNSSVNSKKFNIAKADKKLKFGKLKAGTYRYRIYAHTNDGKVHTVMNKTFKVVKKKSSSSTKKTTTTSTTSTSGKTRVVGMSYPKKLVAGKSFKVKGKVKSNKKIKKVTVGVVNNKTGRWTVVKYTKKRINAKAFNLATIDAKLKFGKLVSGNYKYRVDVTTTSGTKTLVNRAFNVAEPPPVTVLPSSGDLSAMADYTTEVKILDDSSAVNATTGENVMTLSGCTAPGTYKAGKSFKATGTIRSKELIKRVEVGIIFTATNKWMENKYDNAEVNSYTFNLSDAAPTLGFDKIPGGDYKFRIYVHTDSGIYVVLNQPFKVISSNKPQAAVNWAIQIANDNKFSYGKKPYTSKVGCYFCGTNQKRKPKGYEKTYVCMTFVHAAFAHGAGDPAMLRDCQNGSHCLTTTDTNFTHYKCWEKIGYCKDLSIKALQPGDVICYYSSDNKSGHLALYIGNNDIVDAQGIRDCWGAASIAVRKNYGERMLKGAAKFNKRSYVMRYKG